MISLTHQMSAGSQRPLSAFVTGASSGIGRAIALSLAKEGYDLTILGHQSKDALQQLQEEIMEIQKKLFASLESSTAERLHVQSLIGDIADPAFVERAANAHLQQYHGIDLLVNNAGISQVGLLTDMSLQEWQRMMDVNVNAIFYSCKYFIPSMVRAKRGQIVNISSIWGRVGASCEVAYSASKGAVNSFTRALAKELAPSQIQVNALACGMIDTRMNAHLSPEEIQDFVAEIPASRMGTPEDVAQALLALCKSGTYLTGQIIGLDGAYL